MNNEAMELALETALQKAREKSKTDPLNNGAIGIDLGNEPYADYFSWDEIHAI